MELRTEMLDENRFAVEADEVLRAIRDRAEGDVTVWYGFGCEHEDEIAWNPISVPVTELADFIAASTSKGIFRPGRANLTSDVPGLAIQLTLCHESDIHIKGGNKRVHGLLSIAVDSARNGRLDQVERSCCMGEGTARLTPGGRGKATPVGLRCRLPPDYSASLIFQAYE